jgi:gallate decarboxylase subunit D
MNSRTISEKDGGFEVNAFINILGVDILIVLSGGKEHIGAIAIAEPRPSLDDPKKISATGSVYTYIGHKEDVLSKSMSERLSKELNRKIVVVAGMHWDKLTSSNIKLITGICDKLAKRIIREVKEK